MSDRPPLLLDKEEFQAWKDHPATRWVMSRLVQQATGSTLAIQARLLDLVSQPPSVLKSERPSLAQAKGYSEGLITAANLEYESLLTDEEEQALKEAAEKVKQ